MTAAIITTAATAATAIYTPAGTFPVEALSVKNIIITSDPANLFDYLFE